MVDVLIDLGQECPSPSGTLLITQNGTYDVAKKASAAVSVPNTYSSSDEGKVVQSGALVSQTTRTVGGNGTYDTTIIKTLTVSGDEIKSLIDRSVTSVTIPSGTTAIGAYAFTDCAALAEVSIPSTVKSIGANAFLRCSTLRTLTLPSGLTTLGNGALSTSGLTSVTIPSGVTAIPDNLCYACASLTSVTIPEGVTSIGGSAFYGCTALTSLTLPSTITSLGYGAFSNCSALALITIDAATPPVWANEWGNPFQGSTCDIAVPAAAVDAYKAAAGWSGIASRIVAVE